MPGAHAGAGWLFDERRRNSVNRSARSASLDVPAFRSALDLHTYTAEVEAERAAAIELGIQATPTLIINDRVVPVLPANDLRELIGQIIAESSATFRPVTDTARPKISQKKRTCRADTRAG